MSEVQPSDVGRKINLTTSDPRGRVGLSLVSF